jgi:hypothetical protein
MNLKAEEYYKKCLEIIHPEDRHKDLLPFMIFSLLRDGLDPYEIKAFLWGIFDQASIETETTRLMIKGIIE